MRHIIIISLFLGFTSDLCAQTEVQGTIVGQVWNKAESPYKVVGDIQVANLVIKAGVQILFDDNYIFDVSGILTAEGTREEPILFSSLKTTTWKGIRFQNSVPGSKLTWCTVAKANSSGIRIIDSVPVLSNCVIRNNQSANSGGGLYISHSIPDDIVISDCTIANNETSSSHRVARSHGAGIWINSSNGTVRLKRCTIENNQATTTDGGVGGGGGRINGNVEFIRCLIRNNTVDGRETIPGGSSSGNGGGLYIDNGRILFFNTFFSNNKATGYASGGMSGNRGYAYGGGIYINGGIITFQNTIVDNNSASATHGSQGAGIYANAGRLNINNCTLIRNNIHAIHNNQSKVSVKNSIIYFNHNNAAQTSGSVAITYSDIQGGHEGEGNINFNPVLQYEPIPQIVEGSLCIDAGNPDPADNDVCFPPSLGTERNDMGAHGGPNACGWLDEDTPPEDTPKPIDLLYTMSAPTAQDNNLILLPPTDFNLANVIFGDLLTMNPDDISYTDGVGISVNMNEGEGATFYGKPFAVEPDDYVYVRISVSTNNPNVSLGVGALDAQMADSFEDARVNGSIGLNLQMSGKKYVDWFGYLWACYKPVGDAVVPVFQAANNGEPIRVQFDNLEIYRFSKSSFPLPMQNIIEEQNTSDIGKVMDRFFRIGDQFIINE